MPTKTRSNAANKAKSKTATRTRSNAATIKKAYSKKK